ncbi:hypothetical protein FOA52_009530 [Chlamydomonas sp. UWO 241]|nr:hypothetical protein FOA52_009530 [Chlamydomonas sp. UWO 241]
MTAATRGAGAMSRSLQEATVVALLTPGCAELGLSAALATELFRFFCVRIVHPEAGPSTTIEKLWQWMLHNTDVMSEVYSLLGGVIRYSTSSAGDPLHAKTMRRLRALNKMRAFSGEAPCEEFWREPGVVLRRIAVLGVGGVHTGRWVFMARVDGASVREWAEMIALARGYCEPGETLENPSQAAGRSPAAHAAAAPAAASAPHPRGLEGVKRGLEADMDAEGIAVAGAAGGRDVRARPTVAPSASDTVDVVVRAQDGSEVHFKLKQATPLGKVMDAYCDKKSVDPAAVRFVFDGRRVSRDHTPSIHEMENGDVIDVMHALCC